MPSASGRHDGMGAPFRHTLRVRYAEVDMQGHVFNAHYLTYVDDATGAWLRERLGDYQAAGFDIVLKTATLTWHRGAAYDDILAIDTTVSRWGTTSFDVTFEGSVDERPVFTATVTYISVTPGSVTPAPPPPAVRAALA
jgi:acyl-CoA thioester hydrolase